MSRYRKIEVCLWADEKFLALTPLEPSGQGLWLYLLTGPHTSPIPGLFRCGRAAMAEELNWDIEAFDKAFQEVFDKGIAQANWKDRVVWIPNAIKHNLPQSPNVIRSWREELKLIPECAIKKQAVARIHDALGELGDAYVSVFEEIAGLKPSPKPSPKPSGKSSPKTMPNQEQEQEQEQEQYKNKQSPDGDCVETAVSTPTPSGKIVQIDRTPYAAILDCYHSTLPELRAVRKLTPGRQQAIRAAWRGDLIGADLTTWQSFFEFVHNDCPFLTGRKPGKDGSYFYADLEWLMKPANLVKVIEGKYEEGARHG